MKKVNKIFLAWQFDKEEAWLNEMSAKGYQLKEVRGITYLFAEEEKNRYSYKLELLDNVPSHKESMEYIRFVEETGAEYIGSTFRWVYFRKDTAKGAFDLFSDIDSRIKHLNRILFTIAIVGFANILIGFGNLEIFGILHGYSFNTFIGTVCLILGGFLLYGSGKILLKRKALEKQRLLHE